MDCILSVILLIFFKPFIVIKTFGKKSVSLVSDCSYISEDSQNFNNLFNSKLVEEIHILF